MTYWQVCMIALALAGFAAQSSYAADHCSPDATTPTRRPLGVHYGNGGGSVVERGPDGAIVKAQLLDFWEHSVGADSFVYDLGAPDLAVASKVQMIIDRWQKLDSGKAELYSGWFATFYQEACFIPGVKLEPIDDAENIVLPSGSGWAIEQVAMQQTPVFPGDRRYTIAKDIWDHLDNDSRAGLIMHEIMYRDALRYGAKTSRGIRYLNAAAAASELARWDIPTYVKLATEASMGSAFVQSLWMDLNAAPVTFYPSGHVDTAVLVDDSNHNYASRWGKLDLRCIVVFNDSGDLQRFSLGRSSNASIKSGGKTYFLGTWATTVQPCQVADPADLGQGPFDVAIDIPANPDVGDARFPTTTAWGVSGPNYWFAAGGMLDFHRGVLQSAESSDDWIIGTEHAVVSGTNCLLDEGTVRFSGDGKPNAAMVKYCEIPIVGVLLPLAGAISWTDSAQGFLLSTGVTASAVDVPLRQGVTIKVRADTYLEVSLAQHLARATLDQPATLSDANGAKTLYGAGADLQFDDQGNVR